jgi:hypothetical protein
LTAIPHFREESIYYFSRIHCSGVFWRGLTMIGRILVKSPEDFSTRSPGKPVQESLVSSGPHHLPSGNQKRMSQ